MEATMSRTLNFIEHLLARGRRLHSLGQLQNAARTLKRLGSFEHLPSSAVEEVHAELAQLRLAQQHYGKARRHLAFLLTQHPDNAGYLYQMARTHDLDREANPATALEYYRRSLKVDSEQPRCLCDFGLLAVAVGDDEEEGISALKRAAELAPDDPEIVGKVVEGLCQAEVDNEAAKILRAALFRNSRDRRFHQLWSRYQFQRLQQDQQASRIRLSIAEEEMPMILAFARKASVLASKRVRRDKPSVPSAPHFPRPARLPRKKHA
jgi:tetratricopeptide (TPR) repeat protein